MTLILKLDLGMVKMFHHTKNGAKIKAFKSYSPNRHTDRQTHTHTHTHTEYENYLPAYAGGNKTKQLCTNLVQMHNYKKNNMYNTDKGEKQKGHRPYGTWVEKSFQF